MHKKLLVPLLLLLCLAIAPGASAAKGKPRISVSKVDPPPASVDRGASFEVEGTLRNRGKRAFGGSDDGLVIQLRGPDIERTEIGDGAIPPVKPGAKRPFSVDATVPASLPGDGAIGPLGLFACVGRQGDQGKVRCRKSKGKLTVNGAAPPPEPNFTPGSRSLGDPYFPQIGNGGYDALNYDIALDYDPATNTFLDGHPHDDDRAERPRTSPSSASTSRMT